MDYIQDFTNRLEIYAKYEISQHLRQKLAEILASLIEVVAFARQEIKHGWLVSFGKNILSGNDAASVAMAKFVKLVQSETALVGAETLTQAKETSSTLARMDQNVIKISQQLENLEVRGKTTACAASGIKRILQPSSSAEDRLNSMDRSRIPDTGEWVKHQKEFVSWINRTLPVLWISGNPGAGKSYIACSIVNHLKDSFENIDPLYAVSIGFFSSKMTIQRHDKYTRHCAISHFRSDKTTPCTPNISSLASMNLITHRLFRYPPCGRDFSLISLAYCKIGIKSSISYWMRSMSPLWRTD